VGLFKELFIRGIGCFLGGICFLDYSGCLFNRLFDLSYEDLFYFLIASDYFFVGFNSLGGYGVWIFLLLFD
jgi:hypothetical protein